MSVASRLRRLVLGVAVAAVPALAAAPLAAADSTQSTNWAGYAVHHSGVKFSRVLGTWTQPEPTCTPGVPTYSSVWVGIGGYSLTSKALEQIGSEADCSASGRVTSSAWYELVPEASQTVRMTVAPGDRIRAAVAVSGRKVTLSLDDLTRHRSFTRTVTASVVDITSAEWIVEAPSVCSQQGSCQTLPLADFGSTGFTSASARTTAGHTGAITDRRWTATKITLTTLGHRFLAGGPGGSQLQESSAIPSATSSRGSAFTVTYRGSTTDETGAESRAFATSRLVHGHALRH